MKKKDVFSFDTLEINDKIRKHGAFIGSMDAIFPFARGESNIYFMLYQKYVPYNEEMEEAEHVYDYLLKKDVELKRFDDDGQDVLYGVDFLNCKTSS